MRHNLPSCSLSAIRLIATSATLIAALLCANICWADPGGDNIADCAPAPDSLTCTTESGAQINTIVNTPVTMQITEYSTQLMAGIQGGSILYNQTFNAAFSDPTVQAAITAAEGTLTSAGAVSFIGPTLESSNQSLLSSMVNVMQTGSQVTSVIPTVTTYIGPTTLYPGNFGVCATIPTVTQPPRPTAQCPQWQRL